MFESLGKIQNPVVRSLTAAFTTCSIVTLTAAVVLGAGKLKDESAYKAALLASAVGAGCGAVFGLIYTDKGKQQSPSQSVRDGRVVESTADGQWRDWRNFVVMRKVKESEEITSFYLQPQDQGALPNFQPGQFLTIQLEIPGQPRPVIRTYSLSDYPDPCDYYRLSIKREPMPPGLEVMPGIASNFMHDQIQAGAVILAKPPNGRFLLDVNKTTPAVLISNGVGITPMISMAKAATRLNPDRPLWFIHGARDGNFHAFREEVTALAEQHPTLRIHFAYSRPREEDAGHYHSTGYVDSELIQSLIQQDAEYFLCGSAPFLAAIRQGLQQAGIPDSQVFFEMFTKASSAKSPLSAGGAGDAEITFAQSNQTLTWQADAENLLEFAEAHDLNPPYSCRQGICGTCQCKLLEGEVEYQTTPTARIDPGSILICIARPKTSAVVLDL